MTRIEQEIKSSKENFFSVKVVREENRPRKMMRNEQMRLATRNKDQAQIIIKEGYLEKKYNSNIFFKWNVRQTSCIETFLRTELRQAVLLQRPLQGADGGLCQLQAFTSPAQVIPRARDRSRFLWAV